MFACVQGIKLTIRNLTLTIFKRIIKYLKGTTNVGLWYPKGTSLNLIGFSDSDFVGCKLDKKNTSGACHLLGSSFVSSNDDIDNKVPLPTPYNVEMIGCSPHSQPRH